jgi:hypothetical protein
VERRGFKLKDCAYFYIFPICITAQSVRKWVFHFDFLLLRTTLSYSYKTRTNWNTNLKSFMNSNLSLIKFSVSATRGSSDIKPIFNLLPHVAENFCQQCWYSPLWSVSWAHVVLSDYLECPPAAATLTVHVTWPGSWFDKEWPVQLLSWHCRKDTNLGAYDIEWTNMSGVGSATCIDLDVCMSACINNIVTCMRFPWFNNVSTATTMG